MAPGNRDMDTHVRVIGILLIVFWALALLAGLAAVGFGVFALNADPGTFTDPDTGDDLPPEIAATIAFVAGAFLLAVGTFGVVTGSALLKHKGWSRIAGIVLAALALPSVPLGTAFGVYAIWALVQDETKWLFGDAPPQGWERVDTGGP